MLERAISAARAAFLIDEVVIACPKPLERAPALARAYSFPSLAEADVLGRYWACASAIPCDYILRLTADCPMLDPHLLDAVIHYGQGADYCSNVLTRDFPDGTDAELLSRETLRTLNYIAASPRHREHVTLMIRECQWVKDALKLVSIETEEPQPRPKISVDDIKDLERVNDIWQQVHAEVTA